MPDQPNKPNRPERPAYLTTENALSFQAQSVAERYQLRQPYPAEVFATLLSLIADEPRIVLDVGAGTGNLARQLVEQVERVDAVDISPAMVAQGQRLPNGQHPHLRWIVGAIEEVALEPPYALIMGGESIHWMDWETVFPRFASMLMPQGVVALVEPVDDPPPWQTALESVIGQFSVIRNYQEFDLAAELETRGLFTKTGEHDTAPMLFPQSIEDYVGSFHARSALSLDRMTAENAAAFDQQVRDLVAPYSKDGNIELQVQGQVIWGKPTREDQH